MKDDSMMNGQLKAGYNLQIATNNQYILGYDVFPNPTDTRTLTPFLSTLKRSISMPEFIVADAELWQRKLHERSRKISIHTVNHLWHVRKGTKKKIQKQSISSK
ncbi:transposase [Enterococcus lactis]|nr:transposase [Enterococcus lactis]